MIGDSATIILMTTKGKILKQHNADFTSVRNLRYDKKFDCVMFTDYHYHIRFATLEGFSKKFGTKIDEYQQKTPGGFKYGADVKKQMRCLLLIFMSVKSSSKCKVNKSLFYPFTGADNFSSVFCHAKN